MVKRPDPLDVVPPDRIARLVSEVGIRKARLEVLPMLTLAVLAGAFIAFGAMFFTIVVTGSEMGFGPTRLLGGIAFSLGLILVIIGGAELFTGNSLIVMAWASRHIATREILKNWMIVYIGNFIGAVGTAILVHASGILANGATGDTTVAIAEAKLALSPLEAFARGILCNVLVCLAVWMCFAARSVTGKILAIIFPITAFVAMGFEHSVANMYLLPVGMLHSGVFDLGGLAENLVFVTAGNIVGGGILVALVYWLVYLRHDNVAQHGGDNPGASGPVDRP